ncbi:MAG: hypothetical protein LBG80_04435 [Bacteroidales bacterium]|jgi:hypothetical protein|nr:hypothetical protein [Bacteroidales bacterium]
MKQPQLYIIMDHTLNFSEKELCINILKNIPMEEELHQYLLYVVHLTNEAPENPQPIQVEQIDDDGIIWLQLHGICIKIHKHIIQLRFPVIFRAFFDYVYLREAIYNLLKKIFIPCGATELIAHPSYWTYAPYEIKNDWHQKRLIALQEKICEKCNSYKRTKLNLRFCLSNELLDEKQVTDKHYKAWFVKKIISY